jgi:hypothetical protein
VGFLAPASALAETLNDNPEFADTARAASMPGVICSGDLLTIGLNEGGSFIFDGTGFRFPADDPANESLAVAFFGEGWKISYKELEDGAVVDTTAYFQPDLGFGNAEPVSAKLLRDDDQECLYEAVVRTTDGKLVLKFTFQFRKAYPSVVLTTEVRSRHRREVFDIIYARLVDWDVNNDTFNHWTSDSNAAYACEGTTTAGVAGFDIDKVKHSGQETPRILYADEYSWDDHTIRGPGLDVRKNRVPTEEDSNAGIHYKLHSLKKSQSVSVYTLYFAGTSVSCS